MTVQRSAPPGSASLGDAPLNDLHTEISRLIAETSDGYALLPLACRLIGQWAGRALVWCGLVDAETGVITPVAQAGLDREDLPVDGLGWQDVNLRKTVSRAAVDLRSTQMVPDLGSASVRDPLRQVATALGCTAAAAAPMRRGSTVLGVLVVYTNQHNVRRPEWLEALQAVADDLAHGLDHLQAVEARGRKAVELDVLRALAGELMSQGDLETLLRKVVVQATTLLDGSAGGMYLRLDDEPAVRCVVSHPDVPDYTGTVLRYGEGAAGTVAATGKPLILADYAHWPRRARWYDQASGEQMHSLLAVPMAGQGGVIGVLSIWRSVHQPVFDQDDTALLLSFASQAAVALENARLLNDSRQRLYQLTLLNEITRTCLVSLDPTDLLPGTARRLAGLIGADQCLIYLSDAVQPVPRSASAPALPRWTCVDDIGRQEVDLDGLERWLLSGDSQVIDSQEGSDARDQALQRLGVRTALKLALRDKGGPLGGILVGFRSVHRIGSDEIALCEQVAGQLALALDRLLALDAEKQHSAEVEALRQANLQLTSQLDLRTVLEAILEHALSLVGADDAHVFLYDGGTLRFGAAMFAGTHPREPYSSPRPKGLTQTVAHSGERIVIEDARNHPLYEDMRWEGSIAGLPLRIGHQVVGVMNVAYDRPHRFTPSELGLLEALADQAAVALQNARLYEETDAERRRIHLLFSIAQTLASSADPEEILQRATELTAENLGALVGEGFLLERGTERLHLRALYGENRGPIAALDHKLQARLGRGLVGWIAETRIPALVADVREDVRWVHVPGVDEDIRSALGVPILAGDDLLGTLMIFHREQAAFDEHSLDLLVAISRQVGVALSNAEGYQKIHRRLAELTALQQVGQVVNRRLELQPLLEEVVHQVGSVLGYLIVEILLVEGEELVRRAGTGAVQNVPLRIPLKQGLVGRAACSNESALVRDVTQDPDYVCALPQTKSEIVVPLRKGGVVFGVLNVESAEEGRLTEDDRWLLELLGDQISVAVENAALYDRLRQHADRLEQTVAERTAELAGALEQARDADRLKSRFVSDVSHELRTPLSNIRLYLELLKGGKPGRFNDYLGTLDRETGRLVALIEDLLAISRLEAGTAPLDVEPLDLNKLAAGLVEDRRRLFAQKGLKLAFQPAAELPPVLADERAITQVIANLMTNALQYTAQGEVAVSTGLRSSDGVLWGVLTVADTGPGIPPEEQARLFTRFFRGSLSRTTRVPGTGLGLAISKETLDRMGGRITLKSRVGEGTEFTAWLPLASDAGHPPAGQPGAG